MHIIPGMRIPLGEWRNVAAVHVAVACAAPEALVNGAPPVSKNSTLSSNPDCASLGKEGCFSYISTRKSFAQLLSQVGLIGGRKGPNLQWQVKWLELQKGHKAAADGM